MKVPLATLVRAFVYAICAYGLAATVVRFLRSTLAHANIRKRRALLSKLGCTVDDKILVGLFHPYCNAGGGGERVLWSAIACLHREEPNVVCIVYTGDIDASKGDIIAKVEARFSIKLDPARMELAYLQSRSLVEDSTWKRFTLLGQSLGSIVLGHQAMMAIIPDLFIDTMGYAFTFPLVKLYASIPVGAYVHYPTISTDMLQRVRTRSAGHTNASAVAKSNILSRGKLLYYLTFAKLYAFCLRRADHLMVNSTWTQAHINGLLGKAGSIDGAKVVYPPCDTESLATSALDGRERMILSVAQFRPEKEHATQLLAMKAYLDLPSADKGVKLVLAGSVRNEGDEARVARLREQAQNLEIADSVEFVLNPPYPELVKLFSRASIGLSTMVDEHFGISVVEFMAAGLIPLVHASGGPLLDIVTEQDGAATGFHAKTVQDYAEKASAILSLSVEEQLKMRERARRRAQATFSQQNFEQGWMQGWQALVNSARGKP